MNREQRKPYIPTFKSFEQEYCRDLSSEELCEHSCTDNEYMKMYNYTNWLEMQLEKFVDMKKREGYRF